MTLGMVVAVIVVALVFDYTNGFHDAASAVATSISTRALTPRVALLLAAAMNFVGALLGRQVARTVSETIGIADAAHGLVVVLSALLGAIGFNLVTWRLGLPSSSSQALIGGLVGAALAGGAAVHWRVVLDRVLVPLVLSPLIGFALAFVVMLVVLRVFADARPGPVNRGFRVLQTVSAAALALGHGLQDAQKTMGVIFLALVASGHARADAGLPLWVVLAAASAISLGTASGGFRIIRTLGRRLIHVDPARGFVAETVGASVLYLMAFVVHAPISTTQTITSAIVGAGTTGRLSAIRWGVARSIATAWVLTLPAAALAGAVIYALARGVLRLP